MPEGNQPHRAAGVGAAHGSLHNRVAPRPLRGVTPASAAHPLCAVPSRKPQDSPTRTEHDRRELTQSRAGCGHCPPRRTRCAPCLRASRRTAPRARSMTEGNQLNRALGVGTTHRLVGQEKHRKEKKGDNPRAGLDLLRLAGEQTDQHVGKQTKGNAVGNVVGEGHHRHG